MSRLRDRIDVFALPLLVLAGVAAFAPTFDDLTFVLWALGAVTAATALSALCYARGWPLWVSGLLSVVGLVTYAAIVVALAPAADPAAALTDNLVDGLTGSWAELLTVEPPADPDGVLVMVPVLVAWLATYVAVELGFRSDLGAGPLIPAVVAYAVATLFNVDEPAALWWAAVFIGGCFLWLFIRANRTSVDVRGASATMAATSLDQADGVDEGAARRFSLLGRLAFAIPVILIAAGLAFGAAQALALGDSDDPFDPRDQIDRDFALADHLSPLTQVKTQLVDPSPRDLFALTVDGVPDELTIDRVRVAALEEYDGALWTTGATFTRTGSEQPRPIVETPSTDVVQRYRLIDFDGPLLPTIGHPVLVDAESFGVDRDGGQVATEATDLAGYDYTIIGAVPLPSVEAATAAAEDPSPSRAHLAQVPDGMPVELSEALNDLTEGTEGLAALTSLEDGLFGENYGYSTEVPPGHSYGVLQALFGPEGTPAGYSEQYASAFAVLARASGFPARVAVGYLVDPEAVAAGDEIVVTTAEAHAWPEVYLEGIGWVAFEPTDPNAPVIDQDQSELTGESAPQDPLEAPPLVVEPEFIDEAEVVEEPADEGFPWWVLIAVVVLIPILIWGTILLLKRRRRSRRRRRGAPAIQLLGAWQEVLDRLTERRLAADPTMTAFEVTAANRALLPAEATAALTELAPLIDVALYDRDDPDDEIVGHGWDLEIQFETALRADEGAVTRLRHRLDASPLRSKRRRSTRRALTRSDETDMAVEHEVAPDEDVQPEPRDDALASVATDTRGEDAAPDGTNGT